MSLGRLRRRKYILTSSPTQSYKSRALRQRPNIAVSMLDPADPWRRLSITGRVTGDPRRRGARLSINKLSQRYVGAPYPRTAPREIFVITPDKVRAFTGTRLSQHCSGFGGTQASRPRLDTGATYERRSTWGPLLEPVHRLAVAAGGRQNVRTGSATTPCGRGTTSIRSSARTTARCSRRGSRSRRGQWRPSGSGSGSWLGPTRFREPSLVAKMATTLDHISDGRAILGIGAAWFETEHVAFGFPFGSGFPERLRWLGEALPVMRGMLHGEGPTARGERYHARQVRNDPPPIQPALPILVGGDGEKVDPQARREVTRTRATSRRIANVRKKEAVLRDHCRGRSGRDEREIDARRDRHGGDTRFPRGGAARLPFHSSSGTAGHSLAGPAGRHAPGCSRASGSLPGDRLPAPRGRFPSRTTRNR